MILDLKLRCIDAKTFISSQTDREFAALEFEVVQQPRFSHIHDFFAVTPQTGWKVQQFFQAAGFGDLDSVSLEDIVEVGLAGPVLFAQVEQRDGRWQVRRYG